MSPVHGEMASWRRGSPFVPLPAAGLVFPAESSVGEITGSKSRTDDPSPISLVTIENGSRNSLPLLSLSLRESRVREYSLSSSIDRSIGEHACDNDGDEMRESLIVCV